MNPSSNTAPLDPAASKACVLALDTSTELLSVALRGPRADWVWRDEAGGAKASERLLPTVAELIEQQSMSLSQLEIIAFASGPGAFTGLRTAVSAAQGLALGLDRPTLPLDSLMVVAEMARQSKGRASRVAVAMDARMQEIYWGVYAWTGEWWSVEQPPCLLSLATWRASMDELAASVSGHLGGDTATVPASASVVMVGSAVDAWPEAIQREGPVGSSLQGARGFESLSMQDMHVVAGVQRAQALAALTTQQLALVERGQAQLVDAAQAAPHYVRNKVALTTRERDAIKAAVR